MAPKCVRDDLQTRSRSINRSRTSASRRTDDHEARRAHGLGIGEARFGRVGDVDCTPIPQAGACTMGDKHRRHISRKDRSKSGRSTAEGVEREDRVGGGQLAIGDHAE
jgi:hypothetical protein